VLRALGARLAILSGKDLTMKGRGNKAAAAGANVSIHLVAENALSPIALLKT